MSHRYAKGKAVRQTAEAAARHWRRLNFSDLARELRADELSGRIILPVATAGNSTAAPSAPLALKVATNHGGVRAYLADEFGALWRPGATMQAADSAPPMVVRDVALHVGPPRKLGYPEAVEREKVNWTEAFLRSEAHAYSQLVRNAPAQANSGAPLPAVRWITQPLLDGFVSCRVDAHVGVTDQAVVEAQARAQFLGTPTPFFDASPYYGASELLDRWCLFGDEAAMLPRHAPGELAHGHIHRVLEMALGSTVLPAYGGAWLNGAVVADRGTGSLVVILGPAGCGKTTLALHCLAACPELSLVAAERFFLCDAQLHGAAAAHQVLVASVPGKIGVGLGAVLGTLLPNPLLGSHLATVPPILQSPEATAQLLRNTEGAIWNMGQRFAVDVSAAGPQGESRWSPAAVGAVRGVVLLDWDVAELAAGGALRARTVAARMPLDGARDWDRHIEPLLSDWGVVRDHYLLRSIYDAQQAPQVLAQAFAAQRPSEGPTAVRIAGSVDFAMGVAAVRKLLALRKGPQRPSHAFLT